MPTRATIPSETRLPWHHKETIVDFAPPRVPLSRLKASLLPQTPSFAKGARPKSERSLPLRQPVQLPIKSSPCQCLAENEPERYWIEDKTEKLAIRSKPSLFSASSSSASSSAPRIPSSDRYQVLFRRQPNSRDSYALTKPGIALTRSELSFVTQETPVTSHRSRRDLRNQKCRSRQTQTQKDPLSRRCRVQLSPSLPAKEEVHVDLVDYHPDDPSAVKGLTEQGACQSRDRPFRPAPPLYRYKPSPGRVPASRKNHIRPEERDPSEGIGSWVTSQSRDPAPPLASPSQPLLVQQISKEDLQRLLQEPNSHRDQPWILIQPNVESQKQALEQIQQVSNTSRLQIGLSHKPAAKASKRKTKKDKYTVSKSKGVKSKTNRKNQKNLKAPLDILQLAIHNSIKMQAPQHESQLSAQVGQLDTSSNSSQSSNDSASVQQQQQIEQLRNRVDAALASMVGGAGTSNAPMQSTRNTSSPPVSILDPSNLPSGKHWIVDPYGDQGQYEGDLLEQPVPDNADDEKNVPTEKLPHGKGRMEYTDGRIYEGDWKEGHWHGKGKAIFSNRDTYAGDYNQDQRHGNGHYEWSDGRSYKGEFYMDQRQGKGLYTWPDGAKYKGEFYKGLRHGQGDYTFRDGSVYRGAWQKGKYHGKGECHWSDGRIYKGDWVAGKAHGNGIEIRPDGSIRHDGPWENDRPIRGNQQDTTKSTKTKSTAEILGV